jgi:hypothetical protein
MNFKKTSLAEILHPTLTRSVAVLLVVLLSMCCRMIFFQPLQKAVAFSVIDDGLYYLKVAQNIAHSGRMTYDGITTTNGFHPLWLLTMLPIFLIIKDPMQALWGVYGLISVLVTLTALLFVGVAKRLSFSSSGIYGAFFIVFLNMISFITIFSMLEVPLILCVYVILIGYALSQGENRFIEAKSAFVQGVLIGLAFLSRSDSILLVFCYGAMCIATSVKKKMGLLHTLKILSSAASGTALFIIPYLSANFIYFGHIISVSAWTKLSRPITAAQIFAPAERLFGYSLPLVTKYLFGTALEPTSALILSMVPVLLLVLFLIARYTVVQVAFKTLLPITDFMVFAVLHFVFVYFTAPGEGLFSFWYYEPEILATGLLVGVLVSHCCSRNERRCITVCLTFLIVAQFFIYPTFVKNKKITWARLEVAEFVRTNLPRGARLFMLDSGIVSYFSQRDAVSYSGLIGDFEMAQLLKDYETDTVIKRYRITHIIDDGQLLHAEGPLLFQGTIPIAYDQYTQPKVIVVGAVR